ncbi:pre-mRNA processing RNA-helicase, partial [Tulasnella sp. 417]
MPRRPDATTSPEAPTPETIEGIMMTEGTEIDAMPILETIVTATVTGKENGIVKKIGHATMTATDDVLVPGLETVTVEGILPKVDTPKADTTTPAPVTATAPAPVEDEKMRMKRERLEAWKKEREAKKALEEAKAKALALAAGGSGVTAALKAPASAKLPAKPTTALNRSNLTALGLKGLPVKPDVLKNAKTAAAMDDFTETGRKLVKLGDMPPIDMAQKIKKKDLAAVDHSKVSYEPFRSNFYNVPPEIADMDEDQVDLLRLALDSIKIRGVDCPRPITKWSHCGLPASCLDVIKKLGYDAPTPIQSQAIPAIMSGRDVIGVAKTGSGKTMAFVLPLLRHINDQRPLEPMEGPMALIMTPTRELAVQIHRECKPFLKALNLRAVCAYGGSPIKDQIAEMKKGAEIAVCTPGRMIDLLTANSGRVTNLKRVTYLVLDEADRMFDMGFEPQVMKIVNNIRPDRQTVLFSATFPKQMDSLARKILRKPLEITVGGRSVVAAEIEQIVEVRAEETKFNRLLEILGQTYNDDKDARTIIF